MNTATTKLLREFISEYRQGEHPDPVDYYERAGDEWEEIAYQIQEFLKVAPPVELTQRAKMRHSDSTAQIIREVWAEEVAAMETAVDAEGAAEAPAMREDVPMYVEDSIVVSMKDQGRAAVRFLQGLIQVAAAPVADSAFAVKGDGGGLTERLTVPLDPVGYLILRVEGQALQAELEVHNEEVELGDLPTIYFPSVDQANSGVFVSAATWVGEQAGIAVFEKVGDTWRADLAEVGEGRVDLGALSSEASLFRAEEPEALLPADSKLVAWLSEKAAGISERLSGIEIGFAIAPMRLAEVRGGEASTSDRSPDKACDMELDSGEWAGLLGPNASGRGHLQGESLTIWVSGEVPSEGLTAAVETPGGDIIAADGNSLGGGTVEFQIDWQWEQFPAKVGLIRTS